MYNFHINLIQLQVTYIFTSPNEKLCMLLVLKKLAINTAIFLANTQLRIPRYFQTCMNLCFSYSHK